MRVPKVSVLIPTYNYGSLLSEAIESVLFQTFTDFELLIVDNASTDNTDEVVKRYLHDPRVKYVKNETNIGLSGNWNKCLELASGEYIKFLCADDKFKPEVLERFVAILDEYPAVSLVASYREVFGDESKILVMPVQHYQKGRDMIYATINNWNRLGEPSSTMFRRADLPKVGNFSPKNKQFMDLHLWVRLLTIGDCYIIPEPLTYVRSHSAQLTVANIKSFGATFEEYEFYKDMETKNEFPMDVSDMNIHSVVKGRAALVAKLMYRLLPKLHKSEIRRVFKKAFTIAARERVILSPVTTFIKKRVVSN